MAVNFAKPPELLGNGRPPLSYLNSRPRQGMDV